MTEVQIRTSGEALSVPTELRTGLLGAGLLGRRSEGTSYCPAKPGKGASAPVTPMPIVRGMGLS